MHSVCGELALCVALYWTHGFVAKVQLDQLDHDRRRVPDGDVVHDIDVGQQQRRGEGVERLEVRIRVGGARPHGARVATDVFGFAD